MIFFTADLEFEHANIIKLCNRPFKDVNHMNEELVKLWNSVVDTGDTVYILGDFAYKNEDYWASRLNGNKYFIPGNHDHMKKIEDIQDLFILHPIFELKVPDLLDEYGNKRLIVLSHYSMRTWNKSHMSSWHLFGHSHGMLEPYGLSFDVGVDTHDYYPYSLDEVENKMKTLTPIVDYRKPESLSNIVSEPGIFLKGKYGY